MALALFSASIRRASRKAPTHVDHVGAFFRLFQINTRRSSLVWVVLAAAAFAILLISRFAVTDVVLWPDWSAYVARSFVVIGPIMAVWAASLAQRDVHPRRIELLRSTANTRKGRELGLAAMAVIAAVASYAIVAAAVLGYAGMHATWGGPDVWFVLYGAVASAAYALVGWLVGTSIPGRSNAFFIGLLLIAYTIVSYTWGPDSSSLAPLQPWRYVENRWGSSMQLFHNMDAYAEGLHPAGGILVGLGASALLLAFHLRFRDRDAWSTLMAVFGLALLIPGWFVATNTGARTMEPIANPDMVCGGDIVEVCLHQAYEVQLDEAVAFADEFFVPLIGIADVPKIVTQQPYRGEHPPGTLPLNASWTDTPVQHVMALSLGHALMQGETLRLNASQHAILTWLVGQAGGEWPIGPIAEIDPMNRDAGAYEVYQQNVDAAAERFAALSPEAQRSWLEANWDALRAGDLTLEDLP